jgi:hypothetical protein
VLAVVTLRSVAPSGDTVLVWADAAPHRTVLCIQADDGALLMASDPDDELREALDVPLESNQVSLGGEGLGVTLTDHAYNSRLRIGPLDLPWMRNGYSSGIPDWIPMALAATPGGWRAGVVFNVLLGGLILLVVLLIAGRLGGPWAVAIAGCLLVAEPQFHYYKKNLAGTESWLQALAVAVVALTWVAWRRGSWRPLAVAALLAGIGLHVKLSFTAVVASLAVGGLVLAAWRPLTAGRSRAQVLGGLAALALLVVAGLGPTLVHNQLKSTWEAPFPGAEQGQSGIPAALRETSRRLARTFSLPTDPRAGDGSRRKVARGGKEQSLAGVLFAPGQGLRRHFALRAVHSVGRTNGEAEVEAPRVPPLPFPTLVAMPAAALLLLLAIAGGVRAWRAARREPDVGQGDARLVAWAGLLVLVLPVAVRIMQPDPHNMAMVRPLLALGAGLGVAGLVGGPAGLGAWRRRGLVTVVAVLASLTLLGRCADLATFDRDQEEAVGRLFDVHNQRALADALEELQAEQPAVLEHELMSVIEAHTHGRVRPVHYARSAGGTAGVGCTNRNRAPWLEWILKIHEGSYLVQAWGPERSAHQAPALPRAEEIRSVARRLGLRAEPVRELRDSRDRWFATVWAIRRPH